jgi:hypothetical protein
LDRPEFLPDRADQRKSRDTPKGNGARDAPDAPKDNSARTAGAAFIGAKRRYRLVVFDAPLIVRHSALSVT